MSFIEIRCTKSSPIAKTASSAIQEKSPFARDRYPSVRRVIHVTPAVFPPSDYFVRAAHVQGMDGYRELYAMAEKDPEAFWANVASNEIHWFEKWTKVLEWEAPFAKWFVGGTTNVSYNCVDRHCLTHRKNKVAILWEGEPGDQRFITYQELHRLVSRFASVLKSRGFKAGDRAVIYMPMVPELPVAMLRNAFCGLGIVHSVVFGGFSGEALKARIQDLGATLVIPAPTEDTDAAKE